MKLMTHVVVGYPTIPSTIQIVKAMEQAGADYVELQKQDCSAPEF